MSQQVIPTGPRSNDHTWIIDPPLMSHPTSYPGTPPVTVLVARRRDTRVRKPSVPTRNKLPLGTLDDHRPGCHHTSVIYTYKSPNHIPHGSTNPWFQFLNKSLLFQKRVGSWISIWSYDSTARSTDHMKSVGWKCGFSGQQAQLGSFVTRNTQ
jgi:hypothetical protein